MSNTKNIITLESLIKEGDNWEVDISGLGTVIVRDPTVGDRLEVEKEIRKLPESDKLSDLERGDEYQRRLARRMLVNPKISEEDFAKANDATMDLLLVSVFYAYALRKKTLNDAKNKVVRDFLEVMRGSNQ